MKRIIKYILNFFINNYKKNLNYFKIKKQIEVLRKKNLPIKLIIGAGETKQSNWISTDKINLNILNKNDFDKFFFKNEITNIIAEHVFEHLTLDEGLIAIKNFEEYLLKGGRIRIAVPDGFFPKKEYIEYVKPGGCGPGAEDHKILYNYNNIQKLFDDKFKIEFLEYFDESGVLKTRDWKVSDGFVSRSVNYDERNINKIEYTSLIIDAVKIN